MPVDLVYNVETAELVYTNYDADAGEGLPTYDGIEESGRIYRILQKFHNASGMDAVDFYGTPVVRDGTRLAGFTVELGTGVGNAFTEVGRMKHNGLAARQVSRFRAASLYGGPLLRCET